MSMVKPYICSECGEPCNGKAVDFGIGSYEFWGAKGNDTNIQWVSDCCESTILDDTGAEVDPPDSDEDRGDEEYDRRIQREVDDQTSILNHD